MTITAPTAAEASAADVPWFQNEGLWVGFSEMMFSDKRAERARGVVRSSPLFRHEPGTQILDLCCGPGIYLVPLAEAGYAVTGVDLSPGMVEQARQRRNAADVAAEIIEDDMLTYVRPDAYDVIVNMFSSFGYFEDDADNLQVLHNIHRSLRPGGEFLIEVFGKEFLASHDLGRPQVIDLDGESVFVRNTVHHDWSRLRTEWTGISAEGVRTAHIDSQLYSASELRVLLEGAGFIHVEIFGGFDGRPYDLDSKTLLARAHRPPSPFTANLP